MTDLSRANATIFGRYEDLLEEHMTSGRVDPMADDARLSLTNPYWKRHSVLLKGFVRWTPK